MFGGASKEDWHLFSNVLGLTEYLLPTVCDTTATVSPRSDLTDPSKVPSVYNPAGYVVGFPKWPEHVTTQAHVASWANIPQYGICIRTGRLVGIDVDIDDADLASKVRWAIDGFFLDEMFVLPIRTRPNSCRFLMVYALEEGCNYTEVKTTGGNIQRLAFGRQFMVAGTHTSGVKYEFKLRSSTPVIPEISYDSHVLLWDMLAKEFGNGEVYGANRKRGENLQIEDPIVDLLEPLGNGSNGEVYIKCPFSSEHTKQGTIASTVYFPAGTNGYKHGHFHCLHSHCGGRTDDMFKEALGLPIYKREELGFVPVTPEEKTQTMATVSPAPTAYKRDKHGRIYPSPQNLIIALTNPKSSGITIKYDSFKDAYYIMYPRVNSLALIKDADYTDLRAYLETNMNFLSISDSEIRRCVRTAGENYNSFDSAQDWLRGLQWDGVPRVASFLTKCLGAEDSEYSTAISEYIWTALAGRVIQPGVQADMVPVLTGRQGQTKSTALKAMVPSSDLFGELSLSDSVDMLGRRSKGVLVMEIPELNGLHAHNAKAVKAYITSVEDVWNEKYIATPAHRKRRMIFFGTTNEDEFLVDETGNRRWLPFRVLKPCNRELTIEMRDQLWAEGAYMFNEFGVMFKKAEELAPAATEAFLVKDDVWQEEVLKWIRNNPNVLERGYITVNEVLLQVLRFDPQHVQKQHSMRAARVLKMLGSYRAMKWDNDIRNMRSVYILPESLK